MLARPAAVLYPRDRVRVGGCDSRALLLLLVPLLLVLLSVPWFLLAVVVSLLLSLLMLLMSMLVSMLMLMLPLTLMLECVEARFVQISGSELLFVGALALWPTCMQTWHIAGIVRARDLKYFFPLPPQHPAPLTAPRLRCRQIQLPRDNHHPQ